MKTFSSFYSDRLYQSFPSRQHFLCHKDIVLLRLLKILEVCFLAFIPCGIYCCVLYKKVFLFRIISYLSTIYWILHPFPKTCNLLLLHSKLPPGEVLFLSSLFGSMDQCVYPCINIILFHSSFIRCLDIWRRSQRKEG